MSGWLSAEEVVLLLLFFNSVNTLDILAHVSRTIFITRFDVLIIIINC